MSSLRNFAFLKKKTDTKDAPKPPSLRPFLLSLPREQAMSIINSSRPPKPVEPKNSAEMSDPIRDRPGSLIRGTRSDISNQPRVYVPFAPQPSDLAKLMSSQKPGVKCQKCNSNIVLTKVLKDNGSRNVENSHLGEIFNFTKDHDETGAPITIELVWACRINRHVFPAPGNEMLTAPVIQTIIIDPETGGPKRLTFAGAQRWVNQMRELMRMGDVTRAKECMTEIVQMNEGMKKESFTWLEKEKASRMSASLSLPKKIVFQQDQQQEGQLEKPEEHEGQKLLEQFFDEEGDILYQMITSDDDNIEYSGLAIDSSSESNPSDIAATANDKQPIEEPPTVPDVKVTVTVVTNPQNDKGNAEETPFLDDKSAKSTKTSISNSTMSSASLPKETEHPTTITTMEDKVVSKRLSKRFSLTNMLTGFKKVSPSIKRIEGKHDLGKYAEEQAAAATNTVAMLPAQGESMSLHEMLQEPFHRIAEESLEDLSGYMAASSFSISNTTIGSTKPGMPENSLANISSEGIQSDTPSFVTDKSGVGNDSTQDIEHGLTVVTITSEPASKNFEDDVC
ncbi:hypothetical protein TWF706_011469 [Orbilia oligospora]|uniref:Uncharacterized protein n=1 Tax=Orbilia oligospora TaxID=2813651 RepID=A0A7C8JQX2_ORBOL|nr:hypothetical protein TWF706_011469 [Orbilia oligospora]KAF3133618.1 hypothetical protein TWF703_006675 [Orbilia oligospora]